MVASSSSSAAPTPPEPGTNSYFLRESDYHCTTLLTNVQTIENVKDARETFSFIFVFLSGVLLLAHYPLPPTPSLHILPPPNATSPPPPRRAVHESLIVRLFNNQTIKLELRNQLCNGKTRVYSVVVA
jgi:hypothetical protein